MEEGWLSGYIQDYDGQALTLIVPFSDSEYIKTHSVTECSVRVEDGRRISAVKDAKFTLLSAILPTGRATSRRS